MAAFTALAIALAATSIATNAYSQHKAGQAAKKAGELAQGSAESEAALSDYNAAVADLQSADAIARGTENENRFRTQVRGAVGAQRAGFAGSNIDVAFGSAVDVQGDAAYLGELDALQIRTNARREAWGYQVQGEDLRRRAEIQRKEGKNAALAGQQAASTANIQAIGTIIGGTSTLLQTKYGFGGNK